MQIMNAPLAEGSTKAEIFRKSVWWRSGLINLGVTPVEGVGLKSDLSLLSYLQQQHIDIPPYYIAATYVHLQHKTRHFRLLHRLYTLSHCPQLTTKVNFDYANTWQERDFEYCRAHRSQYYYPIAIIARFIHWHFPNTLYFRLARSTTNPSATAHTLTHMGCMHTIE